MYDAISLCSDTKFPTLSQFHKTPPFKNVFTYWFFSVSRDHGYQNDDCVFLRCICCIFLSLHASQPCLLSAAPKNYLDCEFQSSASNAWHQHVYLGCVPLEWTVIIILRNPVHPGIMAQVHVVAVPGRSASQRSNPRDGQNSDLQRAGRASSVPFDSHEPDRGIRCSGKPLPTRCRSLGVLTTVSSRIRLAACCLVASPSCLLVIAIIVASRCSRSDLMLFTRNSSMRRIIRVSPSPPLPPLHMQDDGGQGDRHLPRTYHAPVDSGLLYVHLTVQQDLLKGVHVEVAAYATHNVLVYEIKNDQANLLFH